MAFGVGAEIRRNNFDFLRFCFAVLVILSHSYPLTGNTAAEPIGRITGGTVVFGSVAVEAFFVISGFLIAHSWLHSASAGQYLKKRILRIYPGYLVAMLISFLL